MPIGLWKTASQFTHRANRLYCYKDYDLRNYIFLTRVVHFYSATLVQFYSALDSHLWKKGESGNPSGKPKGRLNKVTLAVQFLLDDEGEKLTRKAIDLAMDGDLTALRLCLERICPPRKSHPINIELPESKTAEGVADAQAAVVQAVGDGEITPQDGQILSNILEARRKSIETQDHESRLAELEKAQATNKN